MGIEVRGMWTRVVVLLWIVAGAASVCLSGGCCTYSLTEHLPKEEPASIVAATVRPDDHLILDCVMTSGRRQRYDADLRHKYGGDVAIPIAASDAPPPPSARALRFGDVSVAKAAELAPDAPRRRREHEVPLLLLLRLRLAGRLAPPGHLRDVPALSRHRRLRRGDLADPGGSDSRVLVGSVSSAAGATRAPARRRGRGGGGARDRCA